MGLMEASDTWQLKNLTALSFGLDFSDLLPLLAACFSNFCQHVRSIFIKFKVLGKVRYPELDLAKNDLGS
jgi:hypothetical protein